MSLIIFFGMAFFIFLGGVTVISVTFYQWYKQGKLVGKEAKQQKIQTVNSN
jgi:hypothetical protein